MKNIMLRNILSNSKDYLKKNSPVILTCIGVVGIVATGVMTHKATLNAVELINEAEVEKGEELTKAEAFKVSAKCYIPPILMGAGTITCVVSATVLNRKQQALLTSAYQMLNTSYKEFKDKVNELYGPDANGKVLSSICTDKYNILDAKPVLHDGKQLFYDRYSDRYYESTMADVYWAECHFNRNFVIGGCICINEYYKLLGIDTIPEGDELGYNGYEFEVDWGCRYIDFGYHTVELEDGLECIIVDLYVAPWPEYDKY